MKSEAKKYLKAVLAGILAGALLVGGVAIAASTRRTEKIEVTYDNIQIVLDGKTLDPKDVLGNKVEPFIYNGTTYLPVRAVGEAIGKKVDWDGVQKIVYLGAKPGEKENWFNQCKPYSSYRLITYSEADGQYFKMSGKEYTDGFAMVSFSDPSSQAYGIFNLDGKYNSVTFTLGHVDGTANADGNVIIMADDEIVYSADLKWDDIAKEVTVPLNGALQMKILVHTRDYQAHYGFANGYFE